MQNQMTSFSTSNNNNIAIHHHHHQTPHTFISDHNNLNHHKYTKRVHNNNDNNHKNVLLRVSGAGQACAACKYQRRKCAPDCALAPYFPHDRQRQFLNAHKLFGVSSITKIIRHLDQPLKDEAMRTIIFQSDVRANDPVGGCYRIIRDLQHHIDYCKAELDIVLHQLAYCRAQAVAAAAVSEQQQILTDHHAADQESFNDNNCDGVVNQADPLVNYNNASPYEQQPIDQYHPHYSYYNHPRDQQTEDDQQYDEIQDGQLDLADINFPWSLHEQESTSTSAPNSMMKQLSVNDQCDNIKEPILEGISGFGSFEQDQTFDQHRSVTALCSLFFDYLDVLSLSI